MLLWWSKHVWGRLYCQCHFYSKSAFNQGVSIASWRSDYQIKIQFNPHCVLTHLHVCCVKSVSRSARGCCLTWSDMRWSDLRDCPGDTRGACGTTRWGDHTFLSHLPHLADFFIYILLQCSCRGVLLKHGQIKDPRVCAESFPAGFYCYRRKKFSFMQLISVEKFNPELFVLLSNLILCSERRTNFTSQIKFVQTKGTQLPF